MGAGTYLGSWEKAWEKANLTYASQPHNFTCSETDQISLPVYFLKRPTIRDPKPLD